MNKRDVVLIVSIFLIAMGLYIGINGFSKAGSTVNTSSDGVDYGCYNINNDNTIKIAVDDNNYNVVEIREGEVRVIEASCPDKICEKHARIHKNGESIICLPNKLVVSITGGEEREYDIK